MAQGLDAPAFKTSALNHSATPPARPLSLKGAGVRQLRCKEARDQNLERPGQTLDVVERDVPGLPLDVSDEGAVQPRFQGQGLLAQATLLAKADEIQRQQFPHRWARCG